MGAAIGTAIPFRRHLPAGLLPAALAQPTAGAGAAPPVLRLQGKAQLILLGECPLVAVAPEPLLDDNVIPADKVFIRNNGQIPEPHTGDPAAWRLRVDGEVATPLDLPLGEIERRFPLVTRRLQM